MGVWVTSGEEVTDGVGSEDTVGGKVVFGVSVGSAIGGFDVVFGVGVGEVGVADGASVWVGIEVEAGFCVIGVGVGDCVCDSLGVDVGFGAGGEVAVGEGVGLGVEVGGGVGDAVGAGVGDEVGVGVVLGVVVGVGVCALVGAGVGVGIGMGVGVGAIVGTGVGTGVGVGVGTGVGVGVGAGVGGALIVVAAVVASVKETLWWLFRADAEMLKLSGPAEMPVTCQLTTALPPELKLPALTVGELTEKCPLCELSEAETLVIETYEVALATLFLTTALTVATCPTFKDAGAELMEILRV